MNTNDIMNNWKNYTNTNTVQEWNDNYNGDPYSDYDTEVMITDFCNNYNYDNNVYNYLYNSYTMY